MPAQHLRLDLCSGDAPSGGACPNPGNWNLIPVEMEGEDFRTPFCNDCVQAFHSEFMESNPDGFQMTLQQAHLWCAQQRLCICGHPGTNCTNVSQFVVREDPLMGFIAVCYECVKCGNGAESVQDLYFEEDAAGLTEEVISSGVEDPTFSGLGQFSDLA